MLLLLAEDDPKIAKLVIHLLNKDGYQVDYAKNGAEALMYNELNNYNVIILDWMMPELSGIEACKILRSKGYFGGILMLTAKDTLEDKILGLETGADDYLIKPFEYRELLARIKALLRRSSNEIKSDVLTLGPFSVDRGAHSVFIQGEPINLSKREYQLFNLLFENNGKTIPRDVIIDQVWGIDGDISQNNLDSFIRLLRKKTEIKGQKTPIKNIRGIGYKLEV